MALMTRFYENLWSKGIGKLEALREAQLWLRAEDVRRSDVIRGNRAVTADGDDAQAGRLPPYYWAAFVLSGDWRRGVAARTDGGERLQRSLPLRDRIAQQPARLDIRSAPAHARLQLTALVIRGPVAVVSRIPDGHCGTELAQGWRFA
jgi:hypothetical protein